MRIGLRTVKTVLSSMLSMAVAHACSLLFWPSAGIIALLSVGNTKRSTLYTGIYRITAFILATLVAFISFSVLGYTILGFGLFLLLFIPVTVYFKLTEGIVVNSVLVTHYLSEQNMIWSLIGNDGNWRFICPACKYLYAEYQTKTSRKTIGDRRKISHDLKEYGSVSSFR